MDMRLEFSLVPWDSEMFCFPVGQITSLTAQESESPTESFTAYELWRDRLGIRFVSCRLSHDRLAESMALESRAFRFIEFVYLLRLDDVQASTISGDGISIASADESDMTVIESIAGRAFDTDRVSMDPRLGKELSGRRYRRWVHSSLGHPRQRLLKILLDDQIVGFFVVEDLPDCRCYWHLTALDPRLHGRGLGQRVWRAMVAFNKADGAQAIETTISARNTPVMHIYAKLGFHFAPPQMTFHWVKEA